MHGDTIVALSSPPGTSGLAVLRVSGPACLSLIEIHLGRKVCQLRHVYYGAFREGGSGKGRSVIDGPEVEYGDGRVVDDGPDMGAQAESSGVAGQGLGSTGESGVIDALGADSRGKLSVNEGPNSASAARSAASENLRVVPSLPRPNPGEIIDRLNFVYFAAPASSTGEDVLELYPHGNMLLVERILKNLLTHPEVRLAHPGEYTRRAFENGKIDLLQAEAVGELIHAETAAGIRNAQRIVGGALSAPLKSLRDALLDVSARLELDVDFSEEEADPDFASWLPRIESVHASLHSLMEGFEQGRSLARAPRIAIVGAPNAGKSSLINALVQEDRLLVSEIPGTTRDYVDVPLRLPGGLIHLVDTAGLGKPVDGLDALAMERTRRQWSRADATVWVEDGSTLAGGSMDKRGGGESMGGPDGSLNREDLSGEISLRLRTKSDLPEHTSHPGYLSVSSLTGRGLPEFRQRLNDLVFHKREAGEALTLATERQFRAVEAARGRVEAALELLRGKPAIEILAFEVREAAGHLKELLGEISSDEVLQKIFAGFCIGK